KPTDKSQQTKANRQKPTDKSQQTKANSRSPRSPSHRLQFEKSGARCYRHAFLNAGSPRVRAGVGAGPDTRRVAPATGTGDGHCTGPSRPRASSSLKPGGLAQPAVGVSGNAGT